MLQDLQSEEEYVPTVKLQRQAGGAGRDGSGIGAYAAKVREAQDSKRGTNPSQVWSIL